MFFSRWMAIGLAGWAALGPHPQDSPTDFAGPPGSAKPFLTATHSGTLLATWFEPRDSNRFALRIAERRGGSWKPAATVAVRDNFFVNWADFPSAVETSGGSWLVHWLEKTARKSYAYHIRVSASADRGKTWSAPATVHSDRSDTEHGFVSMSPRADGTGGGVGGVDLLWLDGRQAESGHPVMALATGRVDSQGQAGPDRLLDSRVCDCCQTALARTSNGLIAVYRDRSEAEIRDIAIVREVNGAWTEPSLVARDNWTYRACPVNGPSVAVRGRQVGVAWYTEAGGTPRVNLAWSDDAGASFGPPIRLDDGSPIGRAELELAPDGTGLLFWLERTGGGGQAEWRLKRVARDGQVAGRSVIASVPATRAAGFTRASVLGRELFVAWTAPGPEGGVRIRRLAIP